MNPSTSDPAPLRNRLRVNLSAPPPVVWDLVGDLTRFPEYSSGLDAVDATLDGDGRCSEYVCHFKPVEPGATGAVHREIVTWYEPNRGFASNAEEPNVFGMTRATTRVVLDTRGEGTELTWEQFYDADDVPLMRAEFDRALADIGENLLRRFGGAVVERTHDA